MVSVLLVCFAVATTVPFTPEPSPAGVAVGDAARVGAGVAFGVGAVVVGAAIFDDYRQHGLNRDWALWLALPSLVGAVGGFVGAVVGGVSEGDVVAGLAAGGTGVVCAVVGFALPLALGLLAVGAGYLALVVIADTFTDPGPAGVGGGLAFVGLGALAVTAGVGSAVAAAGVSVEAAGAGAAFALPKNAE